MAYRFNVEVLAEISCMVPEVVAENHLQAFEKAFLLIEGDRLINQELPEGPVSAIEWQDNILGATVDVVGDELGLLTVRIPSHLETVRDRLLGVVYGVLEHLRELKVGTPFDPDALEAIIKDAEEAIEYAGGVDEVRCLDHSD